jgi:hypothetical protein
MGKKWWQHPTVAVALVGAVGGIAVAVISRPTSERPPLSSSTNQSQNNNHVVGVPGTYPQSGSASSTDEFIRLLEARASKIREDYAQSGDPRLSEFSRLHDQHVQALRANQQIVAHELNNRIQELISEDAQSSRPRSDAYEPYTDPSRAAPAPERP